MQQRAWTALQGLSVGDALGERFFGLPEDVLPRIRSRQVPPGPWRYTDDTEMALSIYEVLCTHGGIDQDALARAFARRFDIHRGYGRGAQELLGALRYGGNWRVEAAALFHGRGSYGNGAAMRVAPIGAWFAEDFEAVRTQAHNSAVVTHAHPEGVAGAIAVAMAAAAAVQGMNGPGMLKAMVEWTPSSATRDGLMAAAELPFDTSIEAAARQLGSGCKVSSQDTVPFAQWCAARHAGSFVDTFWSTVEGLGDRNTTSAISCGVVALWSSDLPPAWLAAREPLPGV